MVYTVGNLPCGRIEIDEFGGAVGNINGGIWRECPNKGGITPYFQRRSNKIESSGGAETAFSYMELKNPLSTKRLKMRFIPRSSSTNEDIYVGLSDTPYIRGTYESYSTIPFLLFQVYSGEGSQIKVNVFKGGASSTLIEDWPGTIDYTNFIEIDMIYTKNNLHVYYHYTNAMGESSNFKSIPICPFAKRYLFIGNNLNALE